MNLCIDQGNSRTKVALFDGDEFRKKIVYKAFTSAEVERLFSLYPIKNAIISSVINIEAAVINVLHKKSEHFVLFDHHSKIPIENSYTTPATLGLDRLAAAVGGVCLFPNEDLLIMDFGSAITYDFVSSEGVFIGGNIAPGIKMRLAVLKQATKKLPLVETHENELLPLFAKCTKDAIKSGVIRGVVYEAKGYMRTLTERLEHFQTIITGGNADYIMQNIQGEAHYEENLVLLGLNKILSMN